MRIHKQKTIRGLTLVEMVITISIFSIIMVVLVQSIIFFYRSNTSSLEQSYQVNSARKGSAVLVKNIREATYGDDGSYPLSNIGSTTVVFFSDTENDDSVEKITYSLSGTTLIRNVLESSGTPPVYTGGGVDHLVSTYVRNEEEGVPLFRFYDVNGTEITDYENVSDVRSVTINLVVNVQPIRAPQEFTLRSSATLRNLKSE